MSHAHARQIALCGLVEWAQSRGVTYARTELVPPESPGFYHCVSRCVRRAFLCGVDQYSGRNFEHRKRWVEDRLLELASIFAVAIYGYAVMSNHVHVVLRIDPSVAGQWSDDEIAARWTRLFASADPAQAALRIERLMSDPARLIECRRRLGNLSWLMRCLSEPIARRANREDQCKGRFWEGRFKCQALLDERAVLAAMAYVDLNPIRAGICTRLERCRHTTISRRIRAVRRAPHAVEQRVRAVAGSLPRQSLSVRTGAYIELVDWTGRQLRPDKRGRIPLAEPPALARLGLDWTRWTRHVRGIGSGYWRAVGSVEHLLEKARSMGQRWLKGIGTAQALASG